MDAPTASSHQPCLPTPQEHYKAEAEKFVASLPGPVQQRVGALKELQTKRDDLEAQFKKELEALEEKYRQLYGMFGALLTPFTDAICRHHSPHCCSPRSTVVRAAQGHRCTWRGCPH